MLGLCAKLKGLLCRVLDIYRFLRLARVHTSIVTLESIHLGPHTMSSVDPDKKTLLTKATH